MDDVDGDAGKNYAMRGGGGVIGRPGIMLLLMLRASQLFAKGKGVSIVYTVCGGRMRHVLEIWMSRLLEQGAGKSERQPGQESTRDVIR